MSTAPQNIRELAANQSQIAAQMSADKPLKGKYDGRRNNGAHLRELNRKHKTGPIPLHANELSRRQAKKALDEFDAIATWTQIYNLAWEEKRLTELVRIRESVENRYFGKPYTATPPDNGKPGWQDNRLQVAIQNLNIGQSGTKQLKGSKSQRNKGESLTIPPSKLLETKATSDNRNYVTVTTTDGQDTSDDAGQPGQDGIAG